MTGDCDSMKFGEKLFSVGFTPSVYDRGIPGARPLQLRARERAAARRRERHGEDRARRGRSRRDAAASRSPVDGPAIVVIH